MAFLKFENLGKKFLNEKNEEIIALSGLSFECLKGEFLCILGPTGCGKTSLLRLAAGLETADSGSVKIASREITEIHPDTTLVFQHYSLFPWRTVLDNVCFGMEMRGADKTIRRRKAKKYIDLIHLNGFEKAYPHELSGGMQQRVAIARALAYDPQLLLMDEPFGALDERTRHVLQEKLLDIWEKEKKTILFVTHNIDEAIFLASRILIMRDRPGSIEEEMPVRLKRPRDRCSQEFLKLHIRIREIWERILSTKTNFISS